MWKGTFSKTLTLSLPAKDEFFLSPLLTGDLIHLSAASLEVLSLYASVSKMSRGATTFAPPRLTLQISQRGVQMRSTILL